VKHTFITVLTAILLYLVMPLTIMAQPLVWVTPSLARTGPADPAGTGATAQIYAGRGEVQSFQVVIQAPYGGLNNVNFSVSNLAGPGGAVIPYTAFTLYREQYVYVNQGSVNWEGTNQPLGAGWYADGLIPFNDPSTGVPIQGAALEAVPFNLTWTNNQPIWVDLTVPRNATAGTYYGNYSVTSNQGNFTGTIALTVWNFTLPLQPTLKTAFSFWTADSTAAEEELLRNKISPPSTTAGTQLSLMNTYGLGSANIPYGSGAKFGSCAALPAPTAAQFEAQAALEQPGLYLYGYTFDEITLCPGLFPLLQQWAYNMHQAGIRNLVTIAPNPLLYDDGSGTGRSAVDIWTMLPLEYQSDLSQIPVVLAKGDSIWSYNTLVQDSYSPKWQIDFAPINFRIQPGFISQSLGFTGLLYWRVDYWSSSPWTWVNNTGAFSTNNYPGEGMLVYPGAQVGIAGVAPSMRLKWLRDGIQDYEYIAMLKNAGAGTWALGLAASMGPDWINWTRDVNALANVRQQLGQQLSQLGGGSSTTAAPATAPTQAAAPVQTAPAPSGSNVAPTILSLTPANGANSVTFSVVVNDANGAGDLAGVGTIISASGSSAGACWFYYNLKNGTVSLADDAGSGWSTVAQGSASTISNSQCSVAGTEFGASESGTSATVLVQVILKPGFNGTQTLYAAALNQEGTSSGYQSVGKWTLP
jgi:hypothetical protein